MVHVKKCALGRKRVPVQKFLKDEGIIKELKLKGMVEGDTVDVAGIEWTYYD